MARDAIVKGIAGPRKQRTLSTLLTSAGEKLKLDVEDVDFQRSSCVAASADNSLSLEVLAAALAARAHSPQVASEASVWARSGLRAHK